jgi:hypothetical protein
MSGQAGVSAWLMARTSGVKILLALGITVGSFILMAFVFTPAFIEATDGLRPFDLNRSITVETMYAELPSYTDDSRRIYLWFALADYVYPAAASAFFCLLWAWMFRRWPNGMFDRLVAGGILFFPLVFMLIDWSENAGFLLVIFAYPETELPTVGKLAGMLKGIKSYFLYSSAILSLLFAAIAVGHRLRRPG